MRLLSRNAEGLFWLARYLERAASLARVIEMQSSYGGQHQDGAWQWLLTLHADEARFRERHELTPGNIIAFYTTDMGNGGSIRASIHWGRENARALRPFIPLEMWVQLNEFHSWFEALQPDEFAPADLPRTCAEIRSACAAQIGTAEGTLYRDEGYLFFALGLLVERADQTSRLLDVKFAQASVASIAPDASNEFVFWTTILRAAAAFQVFRRLEPASTDPKRLAHFLAFNASHPRSIGFCVREIGSSLQLLRGAFHLSGANKCLETWETLTEGLQAAAADPRFAEHLHDFNDWVQQSLGGLTNDISSAFFAVAPPEPAAAGEERAQSQSQSQTQTQSQATP